MARTYTHLIDQLKDAGLRPTRQRLALARLLFGKTKRHVAAEALHKEAKAANVPVSLATVYNTLHQFTRAGLLREVVVESGRSYFDTNTANHHHFYHDRAGELIDIEQGAMPVGPLPAAPAGTKIDRVDVVIRLKPDD